MSWPSQADDPGLASGPQHSGDLGQGCLDRVEVPEHVCRQDSIKGRVHEWQRLPDGTYPLTGPIQGEHLERRIERYDLPLSQRGGGRARAGSQVEQTPFRKPIHDPLTPQAIPSQGENGVDAVVLLRDRREDFSLGHGSHPVPTTRSEPHEIDSNPTYGRSASGTVIVPSGSWKFSMMAIRQRPTAIAVPFNV